MSKWVRTDMLQFVKHVEKRIYEVLDVEKTPQGRPYLLKRHRIDLDKQAQQNLKSTAALYGYDYIEGSLYQGVEKFEESDLLLAEMIAETSWPVQQKSWRNFGEIVKSLRKQGVDVVPLIQEEYPPGTRIRLIYTPDLWTDLFTDVYGTVDHLDSIGTLHMRWDNGSTLGMVCGEDIFEKASPRRFAVMVDSEFVRDAQIAVVPEAEHLDDARWMNVNRQILLSVVEAKDEAQAIGSAAEQNGVSGEILVAYELK